MVRFGSGEAAVCSVSMGLSIEFTKFRSASFSARSCLVCDELPPLFQTPLTREIRWKVFGGAGSCTSNCLRSWFQNTGPTGTGNPKSSARIGVRAVVVLGWGCEPQTADSKCMSSKSAVSSSEVASGGRASTTAALLNGNHLQKPLGMLVGPTRHGAEVALQSCPGLRDCFEAFALSS